MQTHSFVERYFGFFSAVVKVNSSPESKLKVGYDIVVKSKNE